jgi:small GTP-binding protein
MNNIENKENKENISIMIIGEPSVGKTSYYLKIARNIFYDEHIETLGVDFFYTSIIIKNKKYNINFYDASGSNIFENMVSSMYIKMDAIIIMYDVTDEVSFRNIPIWYDRVKSNVIYDIPIFLIGNKIDLLKTNKRCISQDVIDKYIDMYSIKYIEISVKENINIRKSIEKIISKISDKNKNKKSCIIS